MNLIQLGGVLLTVTGIVLLIATLLAWLVLGVAKLARRPIERWEALYTRWSGRFIILGFFGLAFGFGMVWGPSLVAGAKADRGQVERTLN